MHNLDKIMAFYEKVKGCKSVELEIGEIWDPEEFKEMLLTLLFEESCALNVGRKQK